MYKSTFMGLNTALRGVLASQTALDTTGHNIDNVNTEGFTRQRAEFSASTPWSYPSAMSQTTPGQMGTGVEVLRIERLRDQWIDANVRQQLGGQAQQQAFVEQLGQVENALQEPGHLGIQALTERFWTTMDVVAANPQNPSARQAFAEAAANLAQGFRSLSSNLTQIAEQSNLRLDYTVTEINDISSRIATLNQQIKRAIEHGHQPNDLLDARDQLMDELATYVNYTSSTAMDGTVTITFGVAAPITIVDPATPTTGWNPITRADIDAAYTAGELTSGRAFADERLWDPTNGIIPGRIAQIDQLVGSFVAGVNAAHAAGFDLNGAAGGAIFAGTTAATIQLDPANDIKADPYLVAAASSWMAPGEPGNGDNLRTMLDTVRTLGQAALGGQTWEGFYRATVTAIGAETSTAIKNLANADSVLQLAKARREQVSGVSLDEEMTNMLRFQHSYNASARVMTSMDEVLDVLINRTGRVGL